MRAGRRRTHTAAGARPLALLVVTAACLCHASTSIAKPADPRLEPRISTTIKGESLDDALREISAQGGHRLSAAADLRGQRVTLHLKMQRTSDVMRALPRLLSHRAQGAMGYHWRRLPDAQDGAPRHELWRDLKSREDERAHLDSPQRHRRDLIQELVRLAALAPERRRLTESPIPTEFLETRHAQQLFRGLASLSHGELDALANGQRVPVDAGLFPEEEATRRRKALLNPVPQARSVRSFRPTLQLHPGDPLQDQPRYRSSILIEFDQVWDEKYGFLTHVILEPNDYSALPDRHVDLGPHLESTGRNQDALDELPEVLAALAKASSLNLYQEHFYLGGLGGLRSRPGAPPATRRPLREIVRRICALWRLRMQFSGDTLYFWPYDWSHARHCDIPEKELAQLRTDLAASTSSGLDERASCALRYRQEQLSATLRVAVPEAGRWAAMETAALRLYGSLGRIEREQAGSAQGVALSSLSGDSLRHLKRIQNLKLAVASPLDAAPWPSDARLYVAAGQTVPHREPHQIPHRSSPTGGVERRTSVNLLVRSGAEVVFVSELLSHDVRVRAREASAAPGPREQ